MQDYPDIHEAFSRALRIKKPMSVSEWANAHRYVSASSSSEPGPWRTSRTPYLKEIMDCMSTVPPFNRVRKVAIMKGHQIGYTEGVIVNFIGYTIAHAPAPMMLVAPSEKQVMKLLHQKIDPMIHDSPEVKRHLPVWSRSRARNTQVHKDFPGGFLVLVGATVASDLAGTSVRNLLLDEVDRMVLDTDGEGSPVELAVGRTAAYNRKKIVMGSTPVDQDNSVINRWFMEGDQRYYYVPCPHCGHMQRLVIEYLDVSDVNNVHYICEKCTEPIGEKYKTKMLAKGKWVPHNTDVIDPSHRSYHLNSLYSPVGFLSWKDVGIAKLRADKDKYYAQTFDNLYLGLPTDISVSDVPSPSQLFKREKQYERGTNPHCRFITAGVDVQKDRIEVLVVGWQKKTPFILEHHTLWGETMTDPNPWRDVVHLLDTPIGGVSISLMAVDCGYLPHKVFAFKKSSKKKQIKPIKGSGTVGPIIGAAKVMEISESGKKSKTGNNYHEVNTDFLKDEVYAKLLVDDHENEEFVHFPKDLGEEFYQQLCSERKILKHRVDPMERSRDHIYRWRAIRERNEALDLFVYALSMWYLSGAAKYLDNWDAFCDRRQSWLR